MGKRTSIEAEAAQRLLEQRRQAAGVKPRARPAQRERLPWDDPERLAELEQVAQAELAEVGVTGDLANALIGARARQLLRAERDPAWVEGLQAEARKAREADLQGKLLLWNFPSSAADAISTGRNDVGQPLVKTEAEAWLRSALAKPVPSGRLVALVGLLGTGKTLAACRWAASTYDPDRGGAAPDVLYARAANVYSRTERFDGDRALLKRLATVGVLILDECGTEAERADTDSKKLGGLMLQRYEDNLRTVIIANVTKDQFADRYTDAVMSRLYHAGALKHCKQVVRQGEHRRLQQNKLALVPAPAPEPVQQELPTRSDDER